MEAQGEGGRQCGRGQAPPQGYNPVCPGGHRILCLAELELRGGTRRLDRAIREVGDKLVERGYDQPQRIEEDHRLVKPSPQTHRHHHPLASIPSTFAHRQRNCRVKVVDVGFHDATGFLAWVAELALPTGKPGLFDLVLHVGRGGLSVAEWLDRRLK